jgi:large subunit ribosomal protein L17
MKHHKKGRSLGRDKNERKSLAKNQARSLILHGKIKTTETKAKELRPFIEKLVTRAKNDTLASRRMLISRIGDKDAVSKLFGDIGPKYKERKGGYTRIVRLPYARKDGARQAIIEFV